MRICRIGMYIFLSAFGLSCSQTSDSDKETNRPMPLFTRLSSEETGISFVNEIEDTRDFNVFKYRNFYNGGGVAIGDINNDGLPDIFFTANMQKNRLFLNKGDFRFEDITDSAGVAGNKPWDTGVLMVDVNGDGLLDIYVSNAGNMEGDNHDNDLYINNGDLTFTERAKEYNLAESGFSTHAAFFDYDKDGDLDAYLLNNSNVPVSSLGYASDRSKKASDWENVPKQFRGIGHLLLRNDNGKFIDVTEEAGIYRSLIAFGLGVLVCDINGDTYPDIYVSNDFYEQDYLYINQKDGTFSEEISTWTSHLCLSAMGVDIADINNDGLGDIFVTDMMPETNQRAKAVMEFESYDVFKLKQSRDFHPQYIQNTLQVNNGNNTFTEIAYYSGVAKTDWSWAGLMFDMDNDGYKDIYVTNGIIHDLTDIDFVDFLANDIIRKTVTQGEKYEVSAIISKMPTTPLSNYAYRNNKDLTFANATTEWGLDIPSFSNGCAYGDLDNDGDLDLVVNNVNMESFIFRNESRQTSNNNYLQFKLKGEGGNPFAIGAVVRIFDSEEIIMQELMPSRGFQSSVDNVLTFGLGKREHIDSVTVHWPNNQVTILNEVKLNQRITLSQSEAVNFESRVNKDRKRALFSEVVGNEMELHQEDFFNDFNQEGLIAKQLSREGPPVAIGDLNNDGNEDVFIGGAKGHPGRIYLHTGNGKLNIRKSECFEVDALFEDTAAAFLDVDGDGHMDLVVGSGGNIASEKASLITRLYLNNGRGEFVRSKDDLLSSETNISVIAPYDFDSDGDIDLFIGSRSVPGIFGINPKHLLLINNGDGTFVDGTERYAYDLKHSGMITDAKWLDIDGDQRQDLLTVSDWGTPVVLRNTGRRLVRWNSSLDSLHGWWKTVASFDLDQDGDEDLILGNAGLNIPYAGTKTNPMKLWTNDFDENGTIEQIATAHHNEGDYPIHMRKEMTAQLPSLKKANLKASDYSTRTIQQLFKQDILDKTVVKTVNISESVIAINEGGGRFSIRALPDRVQWSCVGAILCTDVNGDGDIDLVAGGNDFGWKPQFSRQDGSFGHVLLGDGTMDFTWQTYAESGIFIRDEIRHLQNFSDKDGNRYILAAINNGAPKVFRYNMQ